MNTKKRLLLIPICLLTILVSTNAIAKNVFCLGNAISTGSRQAIQETSQSAYNAFSIGDYLNPKQLPTISKKERLIKTVGRIKTDTMIKSCFDYETYLYKIRGMKQTAGKLFEESFLRAFNSASKLSDKSITIESTAILGKPHDSADLLVRNKITGKIVDKLQLKVGYQGALNAVAKESDIIKYADCKILVPKDIYEKLVATNKKNILNGSILTNPKSQKLYNALESGKIIYKYDDVAAKSLAWYENLTKRHIKSAYNNIKKAIQEALDLSKESIVLYGSVVSIVNIKNSEEALDQLKRNAQFVAKVSKEAEETAEKALSKTARLVLFYCGTSITVIGSGADVAYGVHMIYDANYQYNMGALDYDLACYKQALGVTQTALGIAGVYLLYSPDPVTKILAPVVIVVGLAVVAIDMWIDYIQAQRNAARMQLRHQIARRCKPEAVDRLLRQQIELSLAL